eukprot:6202641-Pleurochrysis_carterae.AAC.1
MCRISTEQPLKGRTRSESVARTDSLRHARLSQACSYFSANLPGNYQSSHPGGQEATELEKYRRSGAGSKRRRGGWGAPTGWLQKGAQRAAATIVNKFATECLGSGARALREYAYDAMQKWETMHVSANLQ